LLLGRGSGSALLAQLLLHSSHARGLLEQLPVALLQHGYVLLVSCCLLLGCGSIDARLAQLHIRGS
jgi:hypothetical protein